MQVQELKLESVRQFESAVFRFQPGFNLVIGENGAGKTTILRALLASLGSPRQTGKRTGLHERDIRVGADELTARVRLGNDELQKRELFYGRRFGHRSSWSGDGSDLTVLYYGSNEAMTKSLKSQRIRRFSNESLHQTPTGEEFLHETESQTNPNIRPEERFGRSEEIRNFVRKALSNISGDFEDFYWRFEPYDCVVRLEDESAKSAADAAVKASKKTLENAILRHLQRETGSLGQIDQRKIILQKEGYIMGDLDSRSVTPSFRSLLKSTEVASEILSLMESSTAEIRLTPRIVVKTRNGDLLISQLSDGQQRIFSLLVDIARVLSLYAEHQISDSSGIVLIDEIDVHLHPRWQRIIVPVLEDLFPGCQFIATTHSPFVIQAVSRRKIVRTDKNDSALLDEYSNSIEDVVEDVQGVELPQRSKRSEALSDAAEKYFRLLRRENVTPEELEVAEQAYRKASEPFTSNPVVLALLKVENLQSGKR